jgi:uncharacterized membrane protein (UPF0127 family)
MKIKLEYADTFWRRFCGLMFRKQLPKGQGLLLTPCNGVHMCFMRFAIDAIFIDKDYRVLKIASNLRPWLGIACCYKAWGVVEVAAGEAEGINIGDIMA